MVRSVWSGLLGFFRTTHAENPSFFFLTDLASLRREIDRRKASAKVSLRIEVFEPLDEGSDLGLIADWERWIEPITEKARPDFSMDDPRASQWSRMRVEASLEWPDPADGLQKGIVSEARDNRNSYQALSAHTSLPHQLPSGLHSLCLAVHPTEPLKGKVRSHVIRITLWRAREVQIRPVCVTRAAPERARERPAALVEVCRHLKSIVAIPFIVVEQPGYFIP